MKKIIFFGSLIAVFLMIMTPSIPAVQNQVVKNSFREKIIEAIENEDYQSLIGSLSQLINDIEESSGKILQLKDLLNELDKFSDDNVESKTTNTFLKFLLLVIGIACIIIGAFTMYFGSGKSRASGALLAIAGIILVILSR